MKKIPEVIFKFSRIYDQQWKHIYGYKRKIGDDLGYEYPSNDEIKEYIMDIKQLWEGVSDDVLKSMAEVIEFDWDDEKIVCYVVGGGTIPFSEPLTVPVYSEYPEYFIDMLTHELIHQLFDQPSNKVKKDKMGNLIDRKYSDQSLSTKIHIPVLAIHAYLFKKIIGEKRMEINITEFEHLPDYKAAWRIVQDVGYHELIDELKSAE